MFSIFLIPQAEMCFIRTALNKSKQEDFSFRINVVFWMKQKQDTHKNFYCKPCFKNICLECFACMAVEFSGYF